MVCNGLCNFGDGVCMSVYNYLLVEVMLDVVGWVVLLLVLLLSGCVGVGVLLLVVGGGGGVLKGWGWVVLYIGMIWLNGDLIKLCVVVVVWCSVGM